ncbi:MAG: methylaspartate mutase subunit S [Firmicutes bacterium GWF2_51_9]|nr:MAG: methylaspartate mutase subunit S [Firmicutes bacterium GWF2_51_9]OGS58014.1 MAG: methylaspartate mutase subunit S [Firmicutes bacterium GWE2_51_13]HAM64008.1 methylaspartate mutase subunit S [Erysipelotrichaceae bacterium]HBZ42437.1 methylaspartate mutase subunit S [Erysipelotrichaceae bacterium]
MEKTTVVIGVIGADVHAVGNRIIEYAMNQAGFNVVNLGVMVSQKEFVDAAIETNAKAIIVSSLYGHGELDCRGLGDACKEAGLDVLLYVGGNLVVGKSDFEVVEEKFKKMGFDRVYPPGSDIEQGIRDLTADLKNKA